MQPIIVHVLTEETNGRGPSGDAELSIIGIYVRSADAEAERGRLEDAARKEGKLIEGDEHPGDADPDDWDVTYQIELRVVQGPVEPQAVLDAALILTIHSLMNGTEWSADTLDAIGQAFDAAGRPLANFEG